MASEKSSLSVRELGVGGESGENLSPIEQNEELGKESDQYYQGEERYQEEEDQEEEEQDRESDDESEEDPSEMVRNFGSNPLMDRIQLALYQQLCLTDERVTLELREKDEEQKRTKKQREDIGVEMYGTQQQLAKLQMMLEQAHDNYNIITSIRERAEEFVKMAKEQVESKKKEHNDTEKRVLKVQQDLDALNATLRQIEQYNEEMKSEISVTRRATYRAEESIQNMEKEKKQQDVFIDTLTDQLKNLQDTLALYEAQIVSQRQETQTAKETLKDAAQEMEEVEYEKKQLLTEWKSTLISIQKRDEALQAINNALTQQTEKQMAVEAEIAGYKAEIAKEQARNEQLTIVKERAENEIRFMEEQIKSSKAEQERLMERFTMLKRSLEQTEQETNKANQMHENIIEQTHIVESNKQVVERERQKLEEGLAAHKSTQTTVSKAVKNIQRNACAVVQQIHQKELEVSQMENELARIKVDALNTEAHNTKLRESLDTLVSELKEKDSLIEKYEMEIRQRNDEIEKKMYHVDRLNRKYDQLTSGVEDENLGPLEATIKNLGKSIQQTERSNTELQRQWIRDQTELVELANEIEQKTSEIHEKNSRQTILEQRKIRLERQFQIQGKEVSELERGVAAMHHDMMRINEMISKNSELQERLANSNFNMETEFIAELKEMEEESVRNEATIQRMQREKEQLLEEILEAEKQIMLWEKKIQLERETQEALDPEVGQAEVRAMQKEIHRMQLRFEALKRDQERLIKDMERSIAKREFISMQARGKKTSDLTQAAIGKQLTKLRRELKTVTESTTQVDRAIEEEQTNIESVAMEMEKLSGMYSGFEEESNDLQRLINNALYEKQKSSSLISTYERMMKRYEKLNTGSGRTLDQASVEATYQKVGEDQENIKRVIQELGALYPHLSEIFDRVYSLTSL